MKTNTTQTRFSVAPGYTLIEMIGVLTTISVLASLLVPKVFQAVNESKVNNAVVAYNTFKAATTAYYGKWGRFGKAHGVAFAPGEVPADGGFNLWDTQVLIPDRWVDNPFVLRIGDGVSGEANTRIRVMLAQPAGADITTDGSAAGYNLDGVPASKNVAVGTYVVECVITGVSSADARDFNARIDGDALGEQPGTPKIDTKGRVKYDLTAGDPGTLYVYLAHR